MKLLFTQLAFLLALLVHGISSLAQDSSGNTIGVRLVEDRLHLAKGVDLSFQKSLSTPTRLEFNLGYRGNNNYNAFKLVGLFQWVMPLDRSFHWYAGGGAGVSGFDYGGPSSETHAFALVAGDIGIEYKFRIPLLLSVDVRPEFGFGDTPYGENFDFDLGLGIRYQF